MKKLWAAGLFSFLTVAGLLGANPQWWNGETATMQTAAPQEPQRYVFLDLAKAGEAIIAVGEAGQIWRSTDQGQSWQQTSASTPVLLTAVAFPSPDQGWVAGHSGTLQHSTDNGQTWSPLNLKLNLPEDFAALDIAFADQQTGYIVGTQGRVLHTSDGGTSWQLQTTNAQDTPDLTAVAILPSGRVIVTTDKGDVLTKAPGGDSWERSSNLTHQPLFGVLATGTADGVLVFGAEGSVFESEDGAVTWESRPSASQTAYHSGVLLADGSILLGGNSGVIVRRQPGQNVFFLEEQRPLGAVLSLQEANDGTLLVAGEQGLGRSEATDYRFVDDQIGPTGYFSRRQLMNQPQTQHLLQYILNPQRHGYAAESDRSQPQLIQQWIRLDVQAAANDGESGSFPPPEFFPGVQALYSQLAKARELFTVSSLWSTDIIFERMPSSSYDRQHVSLISYADAYDAAEYEALAQRIRRAGVDGTLAARDLSSVRFHLALAASSYYSNAADPATAALSFLKKLEDTDAQESDPAYQIQPLSLQQLFTVAEHQAEEAATTSPLKKKSEETYYLYAITRNGDRYSCDNSRIAMFAQHLEPALRAVDGIFTTLTVADAAKWSQAVAKQGNWKWFTPAVETGYRQQEYGNWASYSCIETLALAYGLPGAANVADDITQALQSHLDSMQAGDRASEIQVTAFRLIQSPIEPTPDDSNKIASNSR